MTVEAARELDLRTVRAAERIARCREAFDALSEGDALVVLDETEPWDVFDALRRERADVLVWRPMAPATTGRRVRLEKRVPKETEPTINRYFSRDHEEIDAILARLAAELRAAAEGTRPADAEGIRRLFAELDARLERHIRWEEEILFPGVEAKAPELAGGPGRVMRAEHEEIRSLKSELGAGIDGAAAAADAAAKAREILNALVSVLVEHNQKEENVYYPMSEQIFTEEEAATILERVRALG